MSLYNGPARGGNRGGKDQFNWESVKSDKDREFYLGHSVKATTGRWQKGKDVFWYTREKQEEEAAKARLEMQAIKQREEDLMNEALGLKPKTLKQGPKPKLDSQDMAKLLGRVDSEEQGQPDPMQDPDAVKGLGYAPNMMTGVQSAGHDVLGGIGIDGDGDGDGDGAAPQLPTGDSLPGPPPRLTDTDKKRMLKEQKKAVKKAKKAAKKAKSAAKKAKKHKAKDDERLQDHRGAEPSGRYQPAAASDTSTSSEPDSPPRRQRHASDDHRAQYADSHGRDRLKRSHKRGEYQETGRHEQHARSSRSPARHGAPDRSVAEAERYRPRSDRSSHSLQNRQSEIKRHRSSHPHHRSSVSPPMRRHRTGSPA